MNLIFALKNCPSLILNKKMKNKKMKPGSTERIRFFGFGENMWKNCDLIEQKIEQNKTFQQKKKEIKSNSQKRKEIKYFSQTHSRVIHII